MNTYQRESKEFIGILIQKNRVTITENIYIAILNTSSRPIEADWSPATIIDGKTGFIIENYPVGVYTIWVRVDTGLESVVKKADTIKIV